MIILKKRKKPGFHIRKPSKGLRRPGHGPAHRAAEIDHFSLVAICLTVLSACAAIVGLAAVLGRIDVVLELRYVPRRKISSWFSRLSGT